MKEKNMDITARTHFGVRYLLPWQKLAIARILEGGRQLVILPTGYGKSLCFLIPALMLDGATLVVYPLIALMRDQKRRMDASGIPAVMLRGGQTKRDRARAIARLKAGNACLALATPEVLQDQHLLAALAQCTFSHIAVDEAHCVSEWGEIFRPAYLALGDAISRLGVRRLTAFTATASPKVIARIRELLFKGDMDLVRGPADRPNLHYSVVTAEAKQKRLLCLALTEQKPMVVFCATRRGAEDTARLLTAFFRNRAIRTGEAGPTVRFYHAELSRAEKKAAEAWFFRSTDGILCATCAYGMGVDKSNIRTTVHIDAPAKPEFFMQEAGRGGRDGGDAKAILLWNRADRRTAPLMRPYAEGTGCRRQVLLDYVRGEQAYCSGCDICDSARAGGESGKALEVCAADGMLVLDAVRRSRLLYTQEESIPHLRDMLNEKDRPLLGVNVWEAKDVMQLLTRLKERKLISLRGMGTREKARLDVMPQKARKESGFPPTRRLRRLRHRLLHRLRHRCRQLARVQERLRRVF